MKVSYGWLAVVGLLSKFLQTAAMDRSSNELKPIRLAAFAVGIVASALAIELFLGFRVNEAAGNLAELIMGVSLIAAAILVLAPLGRSRRLVAALSAFVSVVLLWAINAKFSTSLDVAYGGAYAWSGTRVGVLALLVGPVLGFVAAILTLAFARLRIFNRRFSTVVAKGR
ncbi:hypothetical protein [Brevundimonas vesicularis]|uniref:hypothetical protein n=1 Tax=Brevundimonas vesicularis TaxID=41276 RepID=UPI00384C7E55